MVKPIQSPLPIDLMLDGDIDEQDAKNGHVGAVVDGVGDEGAADLAGERELA